MIAGVSVETVEDSVIVSLLQEGESGQCQIESIV